MEVSMEHDSSVQIELVSEIQGSHGNGKVYLMSDGFLYLRQSVNTESVKYFRCRLYRAGCPGRLVFCSNGFFISTSPHDHDPDGISDVLYRANRQSLLNQAMHSTMSSFEDIFQDPRNANLVTSSHLYNPHRLQRSMIRHRERNLPPCDTLRQLTAILRNPDFAFLTQASQFQGSLYRGSVESADLCHVMLFMSKKGSDLLQMIPCISVLHPAPLGSHQLYVMCVVAGVWEGSVIPLAWIVSEKYAYEALRAGFQLLKSVLPIFHFDQVMSAFDEAGFAFSHVFRVELYPTLYDFIHDLVSPENTGVTSVNANPSIAQIIKLCCGLPLLPADVLQVGINIIIQKAIQFGERTYLEAVPLFRYIEQKWLKVPQKRFTMCGNVDRTNYGSEVLKSTISARIGNNANYFSTLRHIVRMAANSETAICQVLLGQRINAAQVPLLAQPDVVNLLQDVLKPSFGLENAVKNYLEIIGAKIAHLILS